MYPSPGFLSGHILHNFNTISNLHSFNVPTLLYVILLPSQIPGPRSRYKTSPSPQRSPQSHPHLPSTIPDPWPPLFIQFSTSIILSFQECYVSESVIFFEVGFVYSA